MFDRVICIVMDGCGAGAAPDAELFGDVGHNEGHTLANVWTSAGGIEAPTLASIGLFAAAGIPGPEPRAAYGRMREISIGKDTVTGRWEMMGIRLEKPFPTYPKGFPIPLIKEFESKIGLQTIGNEPASGTEIIQRLGPMHLETGCPIVYTSADSVFQVACHEDIIPVDRLYEICRIAREMLVAPNNVGRVIARPFRGSIEAGFTRTENRKDYPLSPPENIVDKVAEKYGEVYGIGVIPEVFCGRGFRKVGRTQDNSEHQRTLIEALKSDAKFIWANFEDFDMLYGHRNDAPGFAKALTVFDGYLATTMARLRDGDLLLLTADHGNDPTTPSTDHSREYVPLCAYYSGIKPRALGDLVGMWQVGETVLGALDGRNAGILREIAP